MSKQTRELEKTVKGFANHRRIEILMLLEKKPDLSVFEVTEELEINFRTASQHIRRLTNSELVWKTNDGNYVRHALSPLGKTILKFLRTLA